MSLNPAHRTSPNSNQGDTGARIGPKIGDAENTRDTKHARYHEAATNQAQATTTNFFGKDWRNERRSDLDHTALVRTGQTDKAQQSATLAKTSDHPEPSSGE